MRIVLIDRNGREFPSADQPEQQARALFAQTPPSGRFVRVELRDGSTVVESKDAS